MSCVAEAKATITAQNTVRTRPSSAAGSTGAMPAIATTSAHCASSIQPRRRPKRRVSTGSGSRSTSGDHRNLNEYAMPTSPNRPISVSDTPACSSRAASVAPVKASGRPLEKPRKSSDRTRRSR